MDNVGTGDLNNDRLTDRDHNGGICRQQELLFGIAGRFKLRDNFGCFAVFAANSRCTDHIAVKAEALVDIFIGPVPLVAGRFDGQVGLRDFLLTEQDRQRIGPDQHQNHDRCDGPEDFNRRVVCEGRGNGVALAVIADRHPKDQTGHEDGDQGDDDQDQVVQIVDVLRDAGHGWLKAHLAVYRLTNDFQPVDAKVFLRHCWHGGKSGHETRKREKMFHMSS